MNVAGYLAEALGAWMFISAFREATHRDILKDSYTEKGKRYAAKMRVIAVGIRVVFGVVLLLVGLRMVGAFR